MCVSEIGSYVVPFVSEARSARALARAQQIIKSSKRLSVIVKKLGGFQKTLVAIRDYVVSRGKVSAHIQNGIENLIREGGKTTLTDIIGVGSCVSLVGAIHS